MTASLHPPKLTPSALRGLTLMAEKYSSLPAACLLPEEAAALKWIAARIRYGQRRAAQAVGVVACQKARPCVCEGEDL